MRLRAEIVVDITSDDYIAAAEHQKVLERFLEEIRRKYPDAKLAMRERRERKAEPVAPRLHDIRRFSIAKGPPKPP